MNQVHPDGSLLNLLNQIVAGGVNYHLFTAPTTDPGLAPTGPGYFTEDTTGGWANVPINVPAANFSLQTVAGHQGAIVAPDIAWTNASGSPQTDYGYFITDSTNTKLLAYGFFDSAPIVTPNLGSLTLTPKFGDQSKYTS